MKFKTVASYVNMEGSVKGCFVLGSPGEVQQGPYLVILLAGSRNIWRVQKVHLSNLIQLLSKSLLEPQNMVSR